MSTKVDKAKQSNTRKCPLKWTSNNRVSTKVDSYHIIKYVFVPCPSRSSRISPNTYSAQAQNMCSAHIFKLLIMFRTRNMCSAHIFKVTYMCLYALICAVLTLLNAATNSTAEKACQTRGARGAPPIIINTSEAKPRFCERYL